MKKKSLFTSLLLVTTLLFSSCIDNNQNKIDDKPGEDIVEPETPITPEEPSPTNPEPETPEEPENPDPEDPADPNPEEPEDPEPETPETPEEPNPENPEEPEPEDPEDPNPENPDPVDPEPEDPVGPDPEDPVDPNPEDPEPEDPEPEEPEIDTYEVIETFSKRMPAEFEPCSMVKMCYPNNMPIEAYKTIAENNKVLLLCNPSTSGASRINSAKNALNNAGANMDNITFLDMDLDSDYTYWVRDFSPFYVFNKTNLIVTDFTYNRPYRIEQNAVPSKLASYFNIGYRKMDLVHTGGNLMQDGRGTAFSDDLVISENSNNEDKVLSQMKEYTGTDNYVITIDPQGDYIAHIDCWGKIVAPDKIIVARLPESNKRYKYYEQVAEQLANTKCIYGYNYRVYRIDEPGGSVVAPYTNSLIANNYVYMPLGSNETYNQKAIKVYQEALPGYTVVGIKGFNSGDNRFLNTDALHCRTHEVPDKDMLFIDSREVFNGEVELQEEYLIKTNVVSYARGDLDNVCLHYSINDGEYITVDMSQYENTTNFTYRFLGLNHGDSVKYYIDASDTLSHYNVDPTCGKLDPHHFTVI